MKKTLSVLMLIVTLVSVCMPAVADEMTEPLNQAVPFGLTRTGDGNGLRVYRAANTRNRIDTIADGQICAIISEQTVSQRKWYKVSYVSNDSLKEGYIAADGLYQLTLAGLMTAASNSSSWPLLKAVIDKAGPDLFTMQSSITATATPAATPKKAAATPKKATATPSSARKRYVLNTKTMKFHLPSCSEVARIAEEARKTTLNTREALISQGYEPCQKCKP